MYITIFPWKTYSFCSISFPFVYKEQQPKQLKQQLILVSGRKLCRFWKSKIQPCLQDITRRLQTIMPQLGSMRFAHLYIVMGCLEFFQNILFEVFNLSKYIYDCFASLDFIKLYDNILKIMLFLKVTHSNHLHQVFKQRLRYLKILKLEIHNLCLFSSFIMSRCNLNFKIDKKNNCFTLFIRCTIKKNTRKFELT